MAPLLDQKVNLVIVSGTTIENIAGGKLAEYFTKEQLKYLYLGLGRGAFNYRYDKSFTWRLSQLERKMTGR